MVFGVSKPEVGILGDMTQNELAWLGHHLWEMPLSYCSSLFRHTNRYLMFLAMGCNESLCIRLMYATTGHGNDGSARSSVAHAQRQSHLNAAKGVTDAQVAEAAQKRVDFSNDRRDFGFGLPPHLEVQRKTQKRVRPAADESSESSANDSASCASDATAVGTGPDKSVGHQPTAADQLKADGAALVKCQRPSDKQCSVCAKAAEQVKGSDDVVRCPTCTWVWHSACAQRTADGKPQCERCHDVLVTMQFL